MLANFIPIVRQPSTQDEQIALARRLILVSGNCGKECKDKLLLPAFKRRFVSASEARIDPWPVMIR